MSVAITGDMTASVAAQAILSECADQILVNLAVVRHLEDDEGPHQLRIGLRRLRSAMAMFAKLLDTPEMTHLKAEAKWLGQMVGKQRDLDVAVVDLLKPATATDPHNSGLAELCDLAATRAKANRPVLRNILETSRAHRFALDLSAMAALAPWRDSAPAKQANRPVVRHMQRALDKTWHKVERRAHGIATLDHAGRHQLRKALKELRYQIEFAAPLFSKSAVRKYIKRMKKLQALFGELNDLAMLNEVFREQDATRPEAPALQASLATLLEQRNASADAQWQKAKTLWAKIGASPAFWS